VAITTFSNQEDLKECLRKGPLMIFQKNQLAEPRFQQNLRKTNLFYLQDVSVTYGQVEALKNVQLSIESGEIIFITGASGAGKTTLLKILSGEQVVTCGSVKRPSPKVAFTSHVFQDLRLLSRKTCLENLMTAYDPNIYESKKNFMQDLDELCKILGVDDRLHLNVMDANGGLKQKVAIIRALLTKPDVFIADEPTSSLDVANARRFFDILNLYNVKRGLTVVWASHNKELVQNFTGRIVHLENGKLIYAGHACFI
jgi:ABC-type multidrug transport system ATPase subunit